MNGQSPSGLDALAERVLCVGWAWGVAVPVPVSVLPCLRVSEGKSFLALFASFVVRDF
jgi:hypothetical protein